MNDHVSPPIEPVLKCPQCGKTDVVLDTVQGKTQVDWFANLRCLNCREHAFLQIELSLTSDDEWSPHWTKGQIETLQIEWQEWVAVKKRHLPREYQSPSPQARLYGRFLLGFIVLGTLFFLVDQYHLLGIIGEDIAKRQAIIEQYSQQMVRYPCFSEAMLEKFRTIPMHYTTESVYHHNKIQYGETGWYWGALKIKIHRSNFWFFGWPKKTQLINTIIHEVRHRASPGLGHSPQFYKLVQEDTQCVLQHWH